MQISGLDFDNQKFRINCGIFIEMKYYFEIFDQTINFFENQESVEILEFKVFRKNYSKYSSLKNYFLE